MSDDWKEIQVDLSEEEYKFFSKKAKEGGVTIEQLLSDIITTSVNKARDINEKSKD